MIWREYNCQFERGFWGEGYMIVAICQVNFHKERCAKFRVGIHQPLQEAF